MINDLHTAHQKMFIHDNGYYVGRQQFDLWRNKFAEIRFFVLTETRQKCGETFSPIDKQLMQFGAHKPQMSGQHSLITQLR